MLSSSVFEVTLQMDSPSPRDVARELGKALQESRQTRETLLGAQLLLGQCEPRQTTHTQENALRCALSLLEKAEGLIDVVRGEIGLADDV